ncbi:MAG: hypothetical protein DME36_02570, partial [Verrucomicrobia bacterium]
HRFHTSRLESIRDLKLVDVLSRKNPYLSRVKGILTLEEFVRAIVDAHLSSQEEGLLGTFLEQLAIYISGHRFGGRKSGIKGIDLEFNRDDSLYLAVVKSGPNWGNDDQIRRMVDNFKEAKRTLRTNVATSPKVICVNGCCYGQTYSDAGDYIKICGQKFWELITGDPDFYVRIVEPLGHRAKEKNEAFYKEYAKAVTLLTRDFDAEFCDKDGTLRWEKIVRISSCAPVLLERTAAIHVLEEKGRKFNLNIAAVGKYVTTSGRFRIRIRSFVQEQKSGASKRSRKWLPNKVDELLDIPSNRFTSEFEMRVEDFIAKCRTAIPKATTRVKRSSTRERNLPSGGEKNGSSSQ